MNRPNFNTYAKQYGMHQKALCDYINDLEKYCTELENKHMTYKEKETLEFLYKWAKAGTFENGGRFDGTDENTVNVEKAYKYLLRRFDSRGKENE